MDFTGRSRALNHDGLGVATDTLDISPAEVWTVLKVETTGAGFLPDRRPQILYERHIFHRLTKGRFADGDISDPTPGGYGAAGAHQYERLARAIELDRNAALRASSWGIGQILGDNFAAAGFPDVEAMVAAMVDSENAQTAAFASFVRNSSLAKSLQAHDWAAFARGYNGPNFKINNYDEKLAQAFQQFTVGPLPDLDVRTAQVYLNFLGFPSGTIDGAMGARTRAALMQFQSQQGFPSDGSLGTAVLQRLEQAALL